jgi:hypothetical protein
MPELTYVTPSYNGARFIKSGRGSLAMFAAIRALSIRHSRMHKKEQQQSDHNQDHPHNRPNNQTGHISKGVGSMIGYYE